MEVPSRSKKSAYGSRTQKKRLEYLSEPAPRVQLSHNMEPTYYIGGGNGNAIIEEVMNGLGWKRIKDKTDENCKLRWCESKGAINYNLFKEGEHLVNHIPNCNLLTNKLGLLNTLQDYNRACVAIQKKAAKLDFIPETYRLDNLKDREAFVAQYKENEIWICKPTGRNQGKGIFLVRSLAELDTAIQDTENDDRESLGKPKKPLNRIIQRYITNPLLIEGRKFDIRCYMLIANTVPFLVLYHQGYLRLSMYEYDNSCDNLIAHLTNQFIQKKDPKYSEVKETTAWSMERFNQYINEKVASDKGLEYDWVYNTLPTTIKRIMTYVVMAVKNRLQAKVGYFDLYGLDFMIDEDMKIWLIEVNINPCLATNCSALKEVVPGVVEESLNLAIECFEKSRRGRPLMPLKSLKDFQIIYSGEAASSGTAKSAGFRNKSSTAPQMAPQASQSQSFVGRSKPLRRVRSTSPVKEQKDSRRSELAKNYQPVGSEAVTSDIENDNQWDEKQNQHELSALGNTRTSEDEDRENENYVEPDVQTVPLYGKIDLKLSNKRGKGELQNVDKDTAMKPSPYFKVRPSVKNGGAGEVIPAQKKRLYFSRSAAAVQE